MAQKEIRPNYVEDVQVIVSPYSRDSVLWCSPRNAGILYVLLCVCPPAFDVTPLRLSPTYVLGIPDALESSASQVLDDCLSSIVRQGLSNGLDDFLLDFGQTSATVHLEDIPALFLHVRLF